ncbi:MAG: InlB B-repeat-containing protein, partial [Bullifex sp.]
MKKRSVMFLSVLMISATLLFAAPTAEKLYGEFSSAVENGDVTLAMKKYSELESRVNKELSGAASTLEKAVKKNNAELYRNTLSDISTLKSYVITKAQSDRLLSAAIASDNQEAISWLYDNSPYYSPVLTFSTQVTSSNRRFSSSSSVSVKPGEEVTIPSSVSVSAAAAGRLAGWGITKDAVTYAPGETIKMPATDQTLYAIFENGVSFRNESTSTDIFTPASAGDEITVPSLSREGAVFAGWYDKASGYFISPDTDTFTLRGNGADFTALWKEVKAGEMSTGAYSYDAIPANTQIPLSFTVNNTGTETLTGVRLSVSCDDDSVTLISTDAYMRSLPAGRSV